MSQFGRKHLLGKVGAFFCPENVSKPKDFLFHTFHIFYNVINQ